MLYTIMEWIGIEIKSKFGKVSSKNMTALP